MSCFKFLGINITEDLTGDFYTKEIVKKSQKCLKAAKETWYGPYSIASSVPFTGVQVRVSLQDALLLKNWTAYSHSALQRVVRTSQKLCGCELPSIDDIYQERCRMKTLWIIKDPSHPNNALVQLLPVPAGSGSPFLTKKSGSSAPCDCNILLIHHLHPY